MEFFALLYCSSSLSLFNYNHGVLILLGSLVPHIMRVSKQCLKWKLRSLGRKPLLQPISCCLLGRKKWSYISVVLRELPARHFGPFLLITSKVVWIWDCLWLNKGIKEVGIYRKICGKGKYVKLPGMFWWKLDMFVQNMMRSELMFLVELDLWKSW